MVAGFNAAMHKLDPPIGYKGKYWKDKDGLFIRSDDGSYNVSNSPEEIGKYRELDEVVIYGKNKTSRFLDDVTNGLGISSDFKESAFILAKKLGNDLTNTKYFKYGVAGLGEITGIYGAYSSTYDFIRQPSLKSGTKAAISIISATKYMNPTVGLILGISDATGFTDWSLNKIYGK